MAGAANSPTRRGIERIARRRWDLRPGRDRGNCWAVAWRVNEQASSSRASVSCLALRRGTERANKFTPAGSGTASEALPRRPVPGFRAVYQRGQPVQPSVTRAPGPVAARRDRRSRRDVVAEPDALRQGDQWAMRRIGAPLGRVGSPPTALYSWASAARGVASRERRPPAERGATLHVATTRGTSLGRGPGVTSAPSTHPRRGWQPSRPESDSHSPGKWLANHARLHSSHEYRAVIRGQPTGR